MVQKSYLCVIFSVFLLAGGLAVGQSIGQDAPGVRSYILALSWSPTFCASHTHDIQCNPQRDYGLILHGLWPQFTDRSRTYCETSYRTPTDRQVNRMLDLTPAPGLLRHQWRKHGTCAYQSPQNYFQAARIAFEQFNVPNILTPNGGRLTRQELLQALQAANPTQPKNSFRLICKGSALQEIRVCLNADLEPQSCRVRRHRCHTEEIVLPSAP